MPTGSVGKRSTLNIVVNLCYQSYTCRVHTAYTSSRSKFRDFFFFFFTFKDPFPDFKDLMGHSPRVCHFA